MRREFHRARFLPHVNHGISGAARLGKKQIFFLRDAQSQRIYQRVLRVTRLKAHFSADGWHAKRISIIGDAANHAIENAPIFGDGLSRDRRS